jgi:hypothetical protein
MNKKDNAITHEAGWLKDFEPAEPIERFAPEQMIRCDACQRNNPPTRLNCFYCGATLPISEKNQNVVRPILRKLENWEKGFNVVHLPSAAANAFEVTELSSFLRFSKEDLSKFLNAPAPLPLARVDSRAEAELIQNRLTQSNLTSAIVADAQIEIEKLPHRVRGIRFGEQQLRLRLAGSETPVFVEPEEIELFVAGALFENRRESSARRRQSGENQTAKDAAEYSADEMVLDFFTSDAPQGFRISANSFDFSCLDARKSLLAAENFKILLETLRRQSPAAMFDSNYKTVRALLGAVWSVDEKKESAGWHHEGIGKINLDSVVTVSNQNQFTKYARILFQTLDRKA